MKANIITQFNNIEVLQSDIENQFKELWKKGGNKIKDLRRVDLFLKIEERKVYFVVNESITGNFNL